MRCDPSGASTAPHDASVYRHCLFCQTDLGRNEIVEPLPIGRRVAFDAGKGRLWIVCRKCERWNLTPFDERWEAIEECERRFRATKQRVSTDNIGLARLAEGLELVRIGDPLRPEMASWRYGDQFGRRRRKHAFTALAAAGSIAALQISLSAAGGAGGMWYLWQGMYTGIVDRIGRTRIPAADGRIVRLVPSKARKARVQLDPDSNRLVLSVKAGSKIERWYDDDARAIAGSILPRANYDGARQAQVRDAVAIVSDHATGADPLVDLLARSGLRTGKAVKFQKLAVPERLAVEMALHEEQERRALQGELAELELRWRAAEEIAAIADSLAVPSSVEQRLRDLKGSR